MTIHYRHKQPVQAVQFYGVASLDQMLKHWGAEFTEHVGGTTTDLIIGKQFLLDGVAVRPGNWVVRRLRDDYVQVMKETFEKFYEPLRDDQS